VSLSNELLYIISETFLSKRRVDEALQLSINISEERYFKQLYDISSSGGIDKKISNIFWLFMVLEKIKNEDWSMILKLLKNEKLARYDINNLYLAAGLARTKSLSSLNESGNSPTQRDFSEYLRKEIIEKYVHNSRITIPEFLILDIGTAIEKAGRRIDALDYYERIDSQIRDNNIRLQCIERWIATKERQAEYNSGNNTWSIKRKQEAAEKRRQYNIALDKKMPEYVDVSDWPKLYQFIIQYEIHHVKEYNDRLNTNKLLIEETNSAKEQSIDNASSNVINQRTKLEFEIENYTLAYFYQKKRLNITSSDGKTISITRNYYSSDDYKVSELKDYKQIEGTSVLFNNDLDKIKIYFIDIAIEVVFGE
jgi:hypothetical protein